MKLPESRRVIEQSWQTLYLPLYGSKYSSIFQFSHSEFLNKNTFSPNRNTKSSFFCHFCLCTIDVCRVYGCVWSLPCECWCLSTHSPLSVLQGHLSPDSMNKKHSEKLWLYSSINLPHSAPGSVSKVQLLDGHIEFRMRYFKTDNGKIHNCTMHYMPISHFSQTVRRPWQTIYSTESIFLLCAV